MSVGDFAYTTVLEMGLWWGVEDFIKGSYRMWSV